MTEERGIGAGGGGVGADQGKGLPTKNRHKFMSIALRISSSKS